jgi:predicted nucleic acid-binding protein
VRVLLDLNVIADVVQQREPHYAASARLLTFLLAKPIVTFIPAHALTTLYYVTEKHRNRDTANELVDWLLGSFEIASPVKDDFRRARTLGMKDFEDAVVVCSAMSAQCDCLITRNLRDFSAIPLPAHTPDQFLAKWG